MKFKIAPEFFVIVKLGVRVTRSPAESRPNGLNGNGVEQPRFRHPDQPGAQINLSVKMHMFLKGKSDYQLIFCPAKTFKNFHPS